MGHTSRRWVPLYERADDPEFESVYDDDHHFAAYARLLIAADVAWPASAAIPAGTRLRSIKALSGVGVIELQGRDRFRMPEVDSRRQQRLDTYRMNAALRWQSNGNTAAMPRHSTEDAPAGQNQNQNQNQNQSRADKPSVGSRGGAMRSFKDLMADFKP